MKEKNKKTKKQKKLAVCTPETFSKYVHNSRNLKKSSTSPRSQKVVQSFTDIYYRVQYLVPLRWNEAIAINDCPS